MKTISMMGIDLAKHVFQLHGSAADGTVLFRRKLRREKLLGFAAGVRGGDGGVCERPLLGPKDRAAQP